MTWPSLCPATAVTSVLRGETCIVLTEKEREKETKKKRRNGSYFRTTRRPCSVFGVSFSIATNERRPRRFDCLQREKEKKTHNTKPLKEQRYMYTESDLVFSYLHDIWSEYRFVRTATTIVITIICKTHACGRLSGRCVFVPRSFRINYFLRDARGKRTFL